MRLRLREARLAKKLTQKALAELTGLKRAHISLIETGRRGASVASWDKLEAALGVDQRLLRRAVKEES